MSQPCTQIPTGPAAGAARRFCAALPRIETDRLVLRAPELKDFPVWTRFFGAGGFDGDEERAWDEFCGYTASWLLRGAGLLSITLRGDDTALGFVFLGMEWEDLETELGWMLDETARGHGYATEAARALQNHGFDLFGDGGFVSYIDRKNTASRAVAGRLKLQREPNPLQHDGDTVDVFRHVRAA
ncbi:MAG: GNAT family N-acetyltransferase [Pseudomonadota bacterium]